MVPNPSSIRDTCAMRRPILLIGIAAAALLASPPPPAGAQATTFQADPAHSGFVRSGGPSPPLRRAWSYLLPSRSSYAVIAGGKVFVVAGKAHGRGAQVLALSARTGRRVWRRDLGRDGGGNPAYDQGRIYVVRGSLENSLQAFSAADGRLLWQNGLERSFSPPVATGGMLYTAGGFTLNAFRGSDGAELWEVIGPDQGVAVANGRVYAELDCASLGAFSADTGQALWEAHASCPDDSTESFAVHAGRLYVHGLFDVPPDEVYDASTGAVVGTIRTDYAPAFAGRIGVFADARLPGEHRLFGHTLIARSLPTGRRRWRFRGDGYLDTAPLIVGRTVYVGSGSGRLYALSLRSGRVLWQTGPGRPVLASSEWGGQLSALAAGEGLLVVPKFQRLVAFRGR
jgi:eukaryotic-like serine/threonine-protein kinase